jgi:telomere length regulation protein
MLLDQYFCPNTSSFTSPTGTAENLVLLAYSSILSQPLTNYGIGLLARLSTEYPLDRLHAVCFAHRDREPQPKGDVMWEDYVRDIMMVPAKVANAIAGTEDISPLLEHGSYFNNLCLRCECLIFSLSETNYKGSSQF